MLLADGNTVTFHQEGGQDIFRKYDANGVLVWNKALAGNALGPWSGEPAVTMMNDGANGFRIARLAGITITYDDSLFEDHVQDSIQVIDVNGIGEVTDAFVVKRTY
ncbi:MAG: hypothetical protein IPO60_11510 [Flavobacteriales bacterium]|nr:hypothetical protein [Flavobacteriales bacterium]